MHPLKLIFIITSTPPVLSIVGGYPVQKALPWMASIQTTTLCGGVLIAPTFILSAAHCMKTITSNTTTITTNSLRMDATQSATAVYWKAISFVIHGEYDETTSKHDLALIYVQMVSNQGKSKISPVSWNGSGNGNLVAYGFGRTSQTSGDSEQLKAVGLKEVDWKVCQKKYKNVDSANLCTSVSGGGACAGDSGGGVMSGQTLAGIISYHGNECASDKYPGVNMRISYYSPWINDKMNSMLQKSGPKTKNNSNAGRNINGNAGRKQP